MVRVNLVTLRVLCVMCIALSLSWPRWSRATETMERLQAGRLVMVYRPGSRAEARDLAAKGMESYERIAADLGIADGPEIEDALTDALGTPAYVNFYHVGGRGYIPALDVHEHGVHVTLERTLDGYEVAQ